MKPVTRKANITMAQARKAVRTAMMDDDWVWPEFPFIQGFGTTHEMRDAEEGQKSRLWNLKSPSRAACIAADKREEPRARKVGFMARRPR
jgi:hypothetical protein